MKFRRHASICSAGHSTARWSSKWPIVMTRPGCGGMAIWAYVSGRIRSSIAGWAGSTKSGPVCGPGSWSLIQARLSGQTAIAGDAGRISGQYTLPAGRHE